MTTPAQPGQVTANIVLQGITYDVARGIEAALESAVASLVGLADGTVSVASISGVSGGVSFALDITVPHDSGVASSEISATITSEFGQTGSRRFVKSSSGERQPTRILLRRQLAALSSLRRSSQFLALLTSRVQV